MGPTDAQGSLSDVPEEAIDPARANAGSPYLAMNTSSTSAVNSPTLGTSPSTASGAPAHTLRKSSSGRTVTAPASASASGSSVAGGAPARAQRRQSSAGSAPPSSSSSAKDGKERAAGRERDGREREQAKEGKEAVVEDNIRLVPIMHVHDAKPAPPTIMYWSCAPVYGNLPNRKIRAHSVTLVDMVAWYFGGCDASECWRDVWCLDTETMEWSHPGTAGDVPQPCRAHSATLVDRRIFVFGGGQGHVYYNDLYSLDTITRRWTKHAFPKDAQLPLPRRAHTTVLHRNRLVVFGGGNGAHALNDVWMLDLSGPPEEYRWAPLKTRGKKPSPRGYHSANLIGDVMVIIGGSDGKASYSDIWCLNLETKNWSAVNTERSHRRLAHTSTQVGSYLFIMGGHDGGKYTSELLLFNLVSLQYEPRQTLGVPPCPRGYHASVLSDGRLFVFGGFNGHEIFNDCYIMDLAGAAYLPQVTSFSINVE